MQSAPVEDNIVVSDIGEQWSPNTDPPSVAARVTIIIEGLVAIIGSQLIITIGIKIPKVPHAVPIENDKNEKIAIDDADKLLKHKGAVLTFMSCGDIYLLEEALKKKLNDE